MRKLWIVLMLLLLSIAAVPAMAQEEIEIEYGDTESFTFDEDNDEVVFIFEGRRRDVIAVAAAFEYSEDIDYAATLEIELQDEDEDRIAEGQTLDYLFSSPGLVAELEDDGEYRIVVEFNGTGEATMNLRVDETTYLNDEPFTFDVDEEGLPTLFGVRVEDDGLYEITLTTANGDDTFDFNLFTFSGGYPVTIAHASGDSVRGWSLIVELEDGEEYIGVMGALLSMVFGTGSSNSSEMSVSMTPFED